MAVAFLDTRLTGFTAAQNGTYNLDIGWPELLAAAASVGAPPMIILPYRRPLIEIEWRILMVASNLTTSVDRHGVQVWRKSDAFEQLDPSEKGAVSYFLGITQAQVTCRRSLGIPLLAHLDTLLKLLGTALAGNMRGLDATLQHSLGLWMACCRRHRRSLTLGRCRAPHPT